MPRPLFLKSAVAGRARRGYDPVTALSPEPGMADAFLAAIAADPDADLPRLLYADWLDERGDERGEFIRLQLAAARGESGDPERESQLLRAHRSAWAGPLRDWAYVVNFHRGLPEHLILPAEDFVTYAPEIVRVAPVRRVTLINTRRWVAELVRVPQLARLTALHLTGGQLGDEGVEKLAACPHLASLRVLRLGGNGVTSSGLAALAASPHLRHLAQLDLPGNDIGDWGARALAATACLTGLKRLDLSSNSLSADAAQVIRDSPALRRLVELNVSGQRVSEEYLARRGLLAVR